MPQQLALYIYAGVRRGMHGGGIKCWRSGRVNLAAAPYKLRRRRRWNRLVEDILYSKVRVAYISKYMSTVDRYGLVWLHKVRTIAGLSRYPATAPCPPITGSTKDHIGMSDSESISNSSRESIYRPAHSRIYICYKFLYILWLYLII